MATYNPKYTVTIITEDAKYDVTAALTRLSRQENDSEIAQRVTIGLANIKVNDRWLSGIFSVRNRVFVYAKDGERNEEVFRGFVWHRSYKSKKRELTLTCYDNLIYFQESEDYQYFSKGYSTKSICGTLCEKWGVKLNYNYQSITHPKLPLRGNLSDIFLTDLLEEVKKKTGVKSVMRSIKDEVCIDTVGTNEIIYKILRGENGNAIDAGDSVSMDGMVTKVIILGKEDDNERAAVEDTVAGDVAKYGTLQKILNVSSGTDLAEVKKEAAEIIKEKGKPKKTYPVNVVDIPWVRKGDKVYIVAGELGGFYLVTSISHDGINKTMDLEVEDV